MFAYSIAREHPSYPATGFHPLPALLHITQNNPEVVFSQHWLGPAGTRCPSLALC